MGGTATAPVVVLRVTVRAPDLDAFINRYSRHIADDRIFIFSKTPQPVGTKVRFNLQLQTGEVLIQGKGTVQRVQAPPGDSRHPPGMEVQFTPLDERSRTLVDFMMATRAGLTQDVSSVPPIVRAVIPSSPLGTPPPVPSKLGPVVPTKLGPPRRPSFATTPSSAAASATASASVPSPSAPPPTATAIAASPPLAPESWTTTPPSPPPPLDAAKDGETQPVPKRDDAPIVPPLADPSNSAPLVFAESFGGDAPANPFSDVSDGAIEYFVEWSLEQSIGPRAGQQARFSEIPMALPSGSTGKMSAFDPKSRRRFFAQVGGIFAAGALFGGIAVAVIKRPASPAPPAAAIAAPPPATATPAATTTAAAPPTEPPPSPPVAAASDAELVITTRPPGATVAIDGKPAGATPLTTHVAAGAHAVTVAKERYAAATSNVDAPGKLALDLRRPTAMLHVTSSPPAADVVIAGQSRGKTPVDVKLPGFESYDVRVAYAGARPWRKTVYLSHASNRVDAALAVGKPPPAAKGRR